MVRGNWQRRVELNESRRKDAKQRKQRQDEKKLYKANVQALLTMLERHGEMINQQYQRRQRKYGNADQPSPTPPSWNICLWTDSSPSDAPSEIVELITDGDSGKALSGSSNMSDSW